jgi:hypothetical protein
LDGLLQDAVNGGACTRLSPAVTSHVQNGECPPLSFQEVRNLVTGLHDTVPKHCRVRVPSEQLPGRVATLVLSAQGNYSVDTRTLYEYSAC